MKCDSSLCILRKQIGWNSTLLFKTAAKLRMLRIYPIRKPKKILLAVAVIQLLNQRQGLRSHSQQICSFASQVVVSPLESVKLVLQLESLVSRDVLHEFETRLHGAVDCFVLRGYLFGLFLVKKKSYMVSATLLGCCLAQKFVTKNIY